MTDEYERWNEALAKHLLEDRPGRPFLLYVDQGVLAEASGLVSEREAKDDFVAAVRSRCTGSEPFAAATQRALSWWREGAAGIPPFLAVIGLTVLAATERTTTHFQYYDDLNTVLGRPVHAKMPPGFDRDIPILFTKLNEWLSRVRVYGTPTATAHLHWSNIGWPLSQALLRPADTRELHVLMARSGLVPGRRLDGQTLLRRITPRISLMAETPSRRRLLEAANRFPEVLAELLERAYVSWDQQEQDPVPVVHRIDLRLAHEEGYGDWWLVGRRPSEVQFTEMVIGGRRTPIRGRSVIEVQHQRPFALVGRGVVGNAGDSVVVRAPGAGPKWLRVDRDAGGWLEQPSADFSVEQLRLLPVAHHSEASRLKAGGAEQLGTAPEGWTLWKLPAGFSVDGREQSSTPAKSLVLDGGLCLDPVSRTYLRSERALPVVTGLADGDVVEIDGRPFTVLDGRVMLPQLPAGDHAVTWEDERVRFRVLDHLQTELRLVPEYGWVTADGGLRIGRLETEGPAICGAWCNDSGGIEPVSTSVPFRTDSIWIMGREGQLAKRDVRPLAWVSSLGLGVTQTDVRRGLAGLDFRPAFAVAFKTSSSPAFVVEVTAEESEAPRPRDVTGLEVQQVVQRLLVGGCQDLEKDQERRWKRALAGLIKGAAR